MHEQRLGSTGLGFQLREQAIDVVDVLGTLHLRDHDHVERVTAFEDRGGEVVEAPRRVERVDAGPELGLAEVDASRDGWRPRPFRHGPPPSGRPERRLRGWRAGCRPSVRSAGPSSASSRWTAGRSGSSGSAGTGSRSAGSAHRRRADGRSLWLDASTPTLDRPVRREFPGAAQFTSARRPVTPSPRGIRELSTGIPGPGLTVPGGVVRQSGRTSRSSRRRTSPSSTETGDDVRVEVAGGTPPTRAPPAPDRDADGRCPRSGGCVVLTPAEPTAGSGTADRRRCHAQPSGDRAGTHVGRRPTDECARGP